MKRSQKTALLALIILVIQFASSGGAAYAADKIKPETKPATKQAKCVALGQEMTLTGGRPGEPKFASVCCETLKTVTHPQDALKAASPGRIICAPCGNNICDGTFENKINCPSDCK